MINYIDNENNLVDILKFINNFEIINDGIKKEILNHSKEFDVLYLKLENLFKNSRLMPAFGVSLHHEALNAIETNTWLKINFNQVLNKSGLPFSALLFQLDEVNGFNLIREYENKYEGRCLFLDLDEKFDMNYLIK